MGYTELKLWRVNLLRLAFAVMAAGLAVTQWPQLAAIGPAYPFLEGAMVCLFSALGLMAAVGVFKPLEMLPVMIFEMVWKPIWPTLVGIPAWLAGTANADVTRSLFDIGLILVFIPFVPWDHPWRRCFGRRVASSTSRRITHPRAPETAIR